MLQYLWKKDTMTFATTEDLDHTAQFVQKDLGPVVQSIVSLTSPLRGQHVKCITTL